MGYNTIQVAGGQTIAVGVQFEKVEGAALPIKSLFSITNPGGTKDLSANSDQIWVFTGADWTMYYYCKPSPVAAGKWVLKDDKSYTEIADTVTVAAGQSVFFRRASNKAGPDTLTLSGALVPLDGTKPVEVAAGETIALAWPWPEAMKVKGFDQYYANAGGTKDLSANSDQIWLFTGADWTMYYYCKPTPVAAGKWVLKADTTYTEVPDSLTIPAGSAFFFRRSSNKGTTTINFQRK